MSDDFFFSLTPDRVLRSAERGGYRPTGHCTPLTCLENRVYDLRLEDESHVVIKFYRPNRWSREAILEEHRFLADLREADIQVCAPTPFPDGETLRDVEGGEPGPARRKFADKLKQHLKRREKERDAKRKH